jgi:very-short-patch-repair endonuclease
VKIGKSQETLTAQAVGSAVYGLKTMKSDHEEVLALFRILIPKFKECSEPFDSHAVSSALYGIQNMKSDNAEVMELLQFFMPKVIGCLHQLGAQEVGNILYGLQNIDFVHTGIETSISDLLNRAEIIVKNTEEKSRHIQSLTYGLTALIVKNGPALIKMGLLERVKVLRRRVIEIKCPRPSDVASSSTEREYQRLARALVERTNTVRTDLQVSIANNVWLHGYEADIVLETTRSATSAVDIINIEIDGPLHVYETKKLFCSIRDEYLREQGIEVVRIELFSATTGVYVHQSKEVMKAKLSKIFGRFCNVI